MSSPFKTIAERMDHAEREFAQTLATLGGCSIEEGRAVCRLYLKHKLAKMDAVMGRIGVKHGAYLDRSAIRNAIAMTKEGKSLDVTGPRRVTKRR